MGRSSTQEHIHRTKPNHSRFTHSSVAAADGENTIQITVQLGSGEFITVFEGAFTK
jgi:hypothetical protein